MDHLAIETSTTGQPVLKILQENYVDWMHACGGKGRCTTCKMVVFSGNNHLAGLTSHEKRFKDLGLLGDNERLTCQTVLEEGVLEIVVPANSKLPHINYSY